MSQQTSTLTLGVRTDAALRNLEALKKTLAEVSTLAKGMGSLGGGSGSAAAELQRQKVAAVEAAEALKSLEGAQRRAEKSADTFRVNMSKNLGKGLSASVRLGSAATVKEVEEMGKKIAQTELGQAAELAAAQERSNSIKLSRFQDYNKRVAQLLEQEQKELVKTEQKTTADRHRQARADNAALVKAQASMRKSELAQLRGDIEERNKELVRQERAWSLDRQRQARSDNKALVQAGEESRKTELSALRADIEHRSRLERESNAARLHAFRSYNERVAGLQKEQQRRTLQEERQLALSRQRTARESNKALITAETAARAQELKQLRADIEERSKLERGGIERRRQTLTTQQRLQDAYHKKDLASRVRHLQQVQRLIEAEQALPLAQRRSTSQVARAVGIVSLRNLAHLPAMERELEALNEGHAKLGSKVPNSTAALRANTKAMGDAHAVARGLSGSLGALWMTYGNLAPLLAAAAGGSMVRSTMQVGKDLEYRLRFVEALGNRAINPEEMMPQVKGSMKTPLEAAEALQALAQAGMTADQSLQALGATMQLSTLGELGMTEAAMAMTGTLSAFRLEAGEASRVGDVFAKAAATSNTSVAKITESMRQASTAAAQYNISVEEVSAALSVMAQRNIVGSMAGTSYRNMLKELYTPIARGAKAMEQLDISAYNADKTMKPLSQILQEIKERLVGMNEESKNVALEAIFGERGGRAIRPILADLDAYLRKVDEMEDATGFLAEANSKLIDSVEGVSNRLQSTLQQSYAKAFDGVKDNVKGLLWTIDSAVASDGFVDTLTGAVNLLIQVAETATQNAPHLINFAKAYGAIKLATYAASAAQSAATQIERAQEVQRIKSTATLQAQTAALNSNTAAGQRNATSKAAGALVEGSTGMARAASAAGTTALWLTRLTSVLGLVTLGYTAVTTVMDHYEKKANKEALSTDNLVQRHKNVTKALQDQAKELESTYQRQRQGAPSDDLLTDNLKVETSEREHQLGILENMIFSENIRLKALEAQIAKEKERGRTGQQHLEATQGVVKLLDLEYTASVDNLTLQKQAEVLQRRINEAQEQRNALLEDEKEKHKAITQILESREKIRSRNVGASLLQPYEQADRQYKEIEAKLLAGTATEQEKKLLPALKEETRGGTLAQHMSESIDRIIEERGTLDASIERGLRVHSELTFAGSRKLQESFSLSSSEKGGGSREFMSNASLIKQRYDQQKSMLASVRDVQLKGIKDLEKVGEYTTEQAAHKTSEVWAAYTEATIKEANKAAAQIRSIDKGSDYLRDLTAQRVVEDAHHQKELGDQKALNEEYAKGIQIQVDAAKARITTAGTIAKIQEKVLQDAQKQSLEYSKMYMTEGEIAAIEARERAESKYNDAIAKQVELWERLVALKKGDVAAAHADPDGPVIQNALAQLRDAQKRSGVAAYGDALNEYMEHQTAAKGVERLFAKYRDEAIKTGDLVANSMDEAFTKMGSALGEFVATGKMNFRSLTVSILENLAKMAAQAALNPLFGMVVKMGMSFLGGGAVDTSYAPDVSAFYAKGGAFSKGQEVQAFAKGGAFTNRITNGTNLAPMAKFGEAGPEAIMPLTRTPDGSLGVRAMPIGAEATGGNFFNVETNIYVQGDGSSNSDNSTSDNDALNKLGAELNSTILTVIRRETRQGGIITKAIKGTR